MKKSAEMIRTKMWPLVAENPSLAKSEGRQRISLILLKRITNIEIQKRIFSKIKKNVVSTNNNDFWLDLKIKS